jgi:4-hydroxybenzoate polyprenyltransferase
MTLLLAYARERLTPARLAPAVLLVVFSTLAGRGWSGATAVVVDAVVALALVAAFRVWDDLVDRERDSVKHPHRVAVTASSITPLWIAAGALGVAAAMMLGLAHGTASVVLLVVYAGVLAASYARHGSRTAAHDRILLLKYGVFTLVLIGLPAATSVRGLMAAAAAFAIACVYEWRHDAESPVFSFGSFGGSR